MRKKTSRALAAMSVLIAGSLAYVGGAFEPPEQAAASADSTITTEAAQRHGEPVVALVEIDADDTVAGFQTASSDAAVYSGSADAASGQQGDGDPATFLIEPAPGDAPGQTSGDGDADPPIAGGPAHSAPAIGQPTSRGPGTPGGPVTSGGPPTRGGPTPPGTSGGDPTGALPPGGDPLPPGPLLADLPSNLPMLLDVPGLLGTPPPGPYAPPAGNGSPNAGPGQTTGPAGNSGTGTPDTRDIAANRAGPGVAVGAPSAVALLSAGLLGMLIRLRRKD